MLNIADACSLIAQSVQAVAPESCSLQHALGKRLALPITSQENSPPFDKSMMDGFAVRVADLQPAPQELKVVGTLLAGQTSERTLGVGEALQIMTGAPIPTGADAVIPIEFAAASDPDSSTSDEPLPASTTVRFRALPNITAGYNIIPCGSNLRVGEEVLAAGTLLRPQEIALLAELGQATVRVRRTPQVAILATGDELVPIEATPGPGQIRNSNALMLAAQVAAWGAEPLILGIARDNRADLAAKIQQGLQADFLCLSGGVSAGEKDLVPQELKAAGVVEVFHKVAMKPGKPVWFGKRADLTISADSTVQPRYVFGLPGNPVSSMVCFELFVATALRKFCGVDDPQPALYSASLTCDFQQRGDREVWFPARIDIGDRGELLVTPTGWKGSSDLRSTVLANGSLRIPAGERNYAAGTTLKVLLWSGSRILPKLNGSGLD